jgi:hypothetical protein
MGSSRRPHSCRRKGLPFCGVKTHRCSRCGGRPRCPTGPLTPLPCRSLKPFCRSPLPAETLRSPREPHPASIAASGHTMGLGTHPAPPGSPRGLPLGFLPSTRVCHADSPGAKVGMSHAAGPLSGTLNTSRGAVRAVSGNPRLRPPTPAGADRPRAASESGAPAV